MKTVLTFVLFSLIALLPAQARDVRVIDGDTIVTNSGERVRLSGIDAASIIKRGPQAAKCTAEMQQGLAAKARVQALLGGADYRVVYDRVKGQKRHDQYGRTLGHVRVGTADVGNVLLAEGLAKAWKGHGPRPDWCGVPKSTRAHGR